MTSRPPGGRHTLNDQIVIISTSAPADRPRYRSDFLKCICYPNGTRIRFIYRKRWIAPELLQELVKIDDSTPIAMPGLITFCDESSANHPTLSLSEQHTNQPSAPQSYTYIPVRFVKLLRISSKNIIERADDDTYLYVDFELDRFVTLATSKQPNEADRKNVESQLIEWHEWLNSCEERPRPRGDQEANQARFVFRTARLPEGSLVENEDIDRISWEHLADRLSKAHSLEKSLFYRFRGFYNGISMDKKQLLRSIRRSRRGSEIERFFERLQYQLRSGNTYVLRLHFFLKPGSDSYPQTLVPRTASDVITLSRPINTNDGLNTETLIILHCKTVDVLTYTTLVIADAEKNDDIHSAEAEFLLMIKPRRWVLPLVVTLIVLGSLSTGITATFLQSFSTQGSPLYDNAVIYETAIKIIGSILVGIGAFLGFGRLPK